MVSVGEQGAHDLVWALNGPALMAGAEMASPRPIRIVDVDVEALDAFLRPRSTRRVGRYFEALIEFWLVCVREVELVGAGVQLREQGRTVGELDFVFRDHDGALVHLEVAVKFFLHHAGGIGAGRGRDSNYPGPNPRDSFEVKADKLFDEQLPRSAQHYPGVDRRQAIVPGIIFYGPDGDPAHAPDRLSPQHRRGRWLRASALGQLEGEPAAVASIAHKPHWLAPPIDPDFAREGRHRSPMGQVVDDLRTHFDTGSGHPVMVSLAGSPDQPPATESERIFVVSDHWPA